MVEEECKVVMTRGRMATMVEEENDEKMVDGDKQQLVIEPAPEPVGPFCELEEVEDEEDDQENENTISRNKKGINDEKKKEKEKEREKEKEKEKDEKDEQREEKKKSKTERAQEKKKEASPVEGREVPYPLVPSKKDKERHFARFLDIFKKLEITMPFEEAL